MIKKIYQKMKNKSLLSIKKYKMRKKPYYDYKELLL